MDNKDKNAGNILPEDKKHLKEDMSDSIKSPMTELESKKETLKKALDKD